MYLYFAFCGKVLAAEELGGRVGCRGFCEKMQEASPMSNGANGSQIQDRPASGQGWAHQWQWKHFCSNRFKKVKNTCWTAAARIEELEYVRETCRHWGWWRRRGRACSRCWRNPSPAEEGAAEMYDELTTTLLVCLPVLLQERR